MNAETVVLPDGRQVVLIHYFVNGGIACMPGMAVKDMSANRERAAPHMRTDAAGAVTCPVCRKKLS